MKKPILYTLLAVFLVCLLTSCQTPSDPPIASQETTAGVSEPEETTKEPEATTAEETTEEETTAEETETDETTVVRPQRKRMRPLSPESWRDCAENGICHGHRTEAC